MRMPIVSPPKLRKTIPLERKIQIGAGMLVLLVAALSWFVNTAFIGLSAFFGAGLIFAGITNLCAMNMILTRMPWNKCDEDSRGSH